MIKKQHIKKAIIILLSNICVYILPAQSQDATINAALQQPQLLMGEQTKLVVQTKTPVDKPVAQWFNLPDTFNHLEILHRSPIDSIIDGNTKIYNQTFIITGFDSGSWIIPPLIINSGNRSSSSAPLELTIIPAKLRGNTYNDIRDIIDMPEQQMPWWYWVLGTLAIIIAGTLVWWWLKRKKLTPAVIPVHKSSLPLLEEALQRLRQLKVQSLPEKKEWKQYYSELTDVFKTFSVGKFHDGALQKTTDELLIEMNHHLSKEDLSELAETLRIADAVKFAKYQPEITRSYVDIDIMERILKKLDSLK